jgi:hypothetical protein
MNDFITERELTEREMAEIINNWTLSVVQRLEIEIPEVLNALLEEENI